MDEWDRLGVVIVCVTGALAVVAVAFAIWMLFVM